MKTYILLSALFLAAPSFAEDTVTCDVFDTANPNQPSSAQIEVSRSSHEIKYIKENADPEILFDANSIMGHSVNTSSCRTESADKANFFYVVVICENPDNEMEKIQVSLNLNHVLENGTFSAFETLSNGSPGKLRKHTLYNCR